MTPTAGDRDALPSISRRHSISIRIRRIAHRPVLARRMGLFLLDGIHIIEEALTAPHEPEAVLVAPRLRANAAGRDLFSRMQALHWPLYATADDVLETLAPTQTPQGVLGLFRRQEQVALRDVTPGPEPLAALVLAGLQDPVNLGALARAARVFQCPRLITLECTVDPFHSRATRASAGLILHLAVFTGLDVPALRDWITAQRIRLVALVPHGGQSLIGDLRMDQPTALVLGSEGGGIPPAVAALCQDRWSIPMAAGVDSLGVAAAGSIALYEALRRHAADR